MFIQFGEPALSQTVPGHRALTKSALIFINAIKSRSRNDAWPIACPNCVVSMTLAHTDPEYGVTPRVSTFVCNDCGVYYTEAADSGGV